MRSQGNNPGLARAALNHYFYKMKSYSHYFVALIVIQVITLFIFNAGYGSSSSNGSIDVIVQTINYQSVVALTVIWALAVSLLLTGRDNKNMSFTVPGSRLSDSLSDLLFLVTGCLFGGVTTALADAAFRVFLYYRYLGRIFADQFYPTAGSLMQIAVLTALIMLVFSSLGYFAGSLVGFKKVFIVFLPVLAIVMVTFPEGFRNSLAFFTDESNLLLLSVKIVVTSALILSASVAVCSRTEVKKI